MAIKLMPPVYEWQTWKTGYTPTDDELGAMSEEEYEHYAQCVIYPTMKRSMQAHPTYKGDR